MRVTLGRRGLQGGVKATNFIIQRNSSTSIIKGADPDNRIGSWRFQKGAFSALTEFRTENSRVVLKSGCLGLQIRQKSRQVKTTISEITWFPLMLDCGLPLFVAATVHISAQTVCH